VSFNRVTLLLMINQFYIFATRFQMGMAGDV